MKKPKSCWFNTCFLEVIGRWYRLIWFVSSTHEKTSRGQKIQLNYQLRNNENSNSNLLHNYWFRLENPNFIFKNKTYFWWLFSISSQNHLSKKILQATLEKPTTRSNLVKNRKSKADPAKFNKSQNFFKLDCHNNQSIMIIEFCCEHDDNNMRLFGV